MSLKVVEELLACAKCQSAHAFVITPNVYDVVVCEDDAGKKVLRGFREAVCRDISRDERVVVAYTLSRGHATYLKGKPYDESDPAHCEIGKWLQKETRLEPRRWGQTSVDIGHEPLDLLAQFERLLYTSGLNHGLHGIALVIENAHYLSPHDVGRDAQQRIVDETLLRWGYDRNIRRSGNIVVLLASETGGLARDLTSSRSGYQMLSAPYPDADQREEVLKLTVPKMDQDTAKSLAQQANGLRLSDIESMGKQQGTSLALDHIKERKGVVLEGVCHGLVELIEPALGLGDANAQPAAKKYLSEVANVILADINLPVNKKRSYVPKGMLFVGPPGNGKSHLTMAFAKDSGTTMVRLKNIRSMWVGESERNMEAVLDILPALRPVVVFLDEIDQMVSARGMGGQATSHEVEQRILGRLLAFMADDRYRGEILWIGATNRPDLLDAALLRRFDRVLPFMNPSSTQIGALVSDVAKTLGLELEDNNGDWEDVYKGMADKDLSCDAVLKVVRHAHEIASLRAATRKLTPADVILSSSDYIPNHNPARYELMCLSSLASVSFVSDLPWEAKADVPGFLQKYLIFRRGTVAGLDKSAVTQRLAEMGNIL